MKLVFLSKFNELFDCCNGSYRDQWIHCNKPNLKPYVSGDDDTFKKYEEMIEYLNKWKKQVAAEPNVSQEERNTRILSKQTLDAWEMICRALPAAIKFLLEEKTRYVNARVFCQDPLEQHFSKQRALMGGNRNPSVDQYLRNENNIHLQGRLSLKRRGTNTSHDAGNDSSIMLPLPKRPKMTRRSIFPE